MNKNKSGFTIVELLIVIVVIAILAVITVIAFNGIQSRARDGQRAQDFTSIKKSIELYKTEVGQIPPKTTNTSCLSSSWEQSKWPSGNTCSSEVFLSPVAEKYSKLPSGPGDSSSLYKYNIFTAGTYSCAVERGRFYAIIATGIENGKGVEMSDTSACGSAYDAGANQAAPTATRAVFIGTEN